MSRLNGTERYSTFFPSISLQIESKSNEPTAIIFSQSMRTLEIHYRNKFESTKGETAKKAILNPSTSFSFCSHEKVRKRLWIESSWMRAKDIIIPKLLSSGVMKNAFNENRLRRSWNGFRIRSLWDPRRKKALNFLLSVNNSPRSLFDQPSPLIGSLSSSIRLSVVARFESSSWDMKKSVARTKVMGNYHADR